jgi:hypothetical protein
VDGFDLFRVNYNLVMRNYEAKEFSGWHPEDALRGIEHHIVFPKIFEGFLKVANKIVSFPAHHHDAGNIRVYVPANLQTWSKRDDINYGSYLSIENIHIATHFMLYLAKTMPIMHDY